MFEKGRFGIVILIYTPVLCFRCQIGHHHYFIFESKGGFPRLATKPPTFSTVRFYFAGRLKIDRGEEFQTCSFPTFDFRLSNRTGTRSTSYPAPNTTLTAITTLQIKKEKSGEILMALVHRAATSTFIFVY